MTKIKLTDTLGDVVYKMSEGNPGGMRVCADIIEYGGEIDTDAAMGGIGIVLLLDTYEVYGSKIWMLYKDVCREELWKTIAIMRACQLGIISKDQLHYAIENRGKGIDIEATLNEVLGCLHGFVVPSDQED